MGKVEQPVFVAVDIGGTFTDVALVESGAAPSICKVLTTHSDYCRGVLEGINLALTRSGLSRQRVQRVVHATTLGSNTLIESSGAMTGLITTKGFKDLTEIGRLRRPTLYDVFWNKPKALVPRNLRREINERTAADGSILMHPDSSAVLAVASDLVQAGVQSIAVCCINSYVNSTTEEFIRDIIRSRFPKIHIVTSSETLREIKEYERFSTTIINGYLAPVFRSYVARLISELQAIDITAPLMMMQSSGGLISAQVAANQPVKVIESGPAAGVLGVARLAQAMGLDRVISLDMGGTTAKASVIENGHPRQSYEYEVGPGLHQGTRLFGGDGYVVRVPAIDVAEIGAGGGSIASIDPVGVIHVGPKSAGSNPGPACYGLGGEKPTVTDANVMLGYINPRSLGAGALTMKSDEAEKALTGLRGRDGNASEDIAWTVHAVACSNMLRAIRAVTTENGLDPSGFDLVSFGGSGSLHSAFVARSLGISKVVVPAMAGIYSAVGLLGADATYDEVQSILKLVSDLKVDDVNAIIESVKQRLLVRVAADEMDMAAMQSRLLADLRYKGQGTELTVEIEKPATTDGEMRGQLQRQFVKSYRSAYGREVEGAGIELVNIRIAARIPLIQGVSFAKLGARLRTKAKAETLQSRRAYFGPLGWRVVTIFPDRFLLGDKEHHGPLIIEDPDSTIVVPPGDAVKLDEYANLIISINAASS